MATGLVAETEEEAGFSVAGYKAVIQVGGRTRPRSGLRSARETWRGLTGEDTLVWPAQITAVDHLGDACARRVEP